MVDMAVLRRKGSPTGAEEVVWSHSKHNRRTESTSRSGRTEENLRGRSSTYRREETESLDLETQSYDTMPASVSIDVISLATASIVIANERVKDHASSTFLVGPTKLKNLRPRS
jgi:hypothetical protein